MQDSIRKFRVQCQKVCAVLGYLQALERYLAIRSAYDNVIVVHGDQLGLHEKNLPGSVLWGHAQPSDL